MNGLEQVRIVLVGTSHPGNIGAVARAMKNMGLRRLYLVAPRQFPADEALWRAANAADVLAAATVVDSLEAAVADCPLVVGTSARERRIAWPLLDARPAARQIAGEARNHPVAVVFGREDRGLTNEELGRCHLHLSIPTDSAYSALNLAMAVQIVCYELRMACGDGADPGDPMLGWDVEMATAADVERFYAHLESVLLRLGFLNPAAPKQLMTRLRRLFQRTRMDRMEVSILRGVLTAVEQRCEGTSPADNT